MKRIFGIFAASSFMLLTGLTGVAQAQTIANPLSFVAGAGYGRGGDIVAIGEYTDGSLTNVKAGNGLEIYLGGAYRLNEQFAVQADVGYQSSTGNADNGELTFKRFPIELLGYYYLNNSWRLGAGARFDERVKLTGSGVASAANFDFDSAVGAIGEIEYLVTPEFGIKLRAVKESFKPTGYSDTFSGNQIALLATIYF